MKYLIRIGLLLLLFVIVAFTPTASAQCGSLMLVGVGGSCGGPIILDATCTGTGNAVTVPCSSAMTVTAGDTIVCEGAGNDFDPESLTFNDTVNGFYDGIEGLPHPNASTTTWDAAGVFQNSAGGSITPQVWNYEGVTLNIKCRALKGTRSSLVLDGGAVNQTNSTTAANPTSGTAAAPTNANEYVGGWMVRSALATVTDAAPWVPGSAITAVGSSYPIYDHYQIQTTAVTANSPMTATSTAFVDSQFAILNNSNPPGYKGLFGFYGAPAIAKTNAANATIADLNGATTTLADVNNSPTTGWTLTGTAGIYDTSIAPSGTGKILVEGVGHSFGDAATSIQFTGAQTASNYEWDAQILNLGWREYYSTFFRVGSSGITSGQVCDGHSVFGSVGENGFVLQAQYNTGPGLQFLLENIGGTTGSSVQGSGLTLDTDYFVQMQLGGANDRFSNTYIYSKSGSVWSLATTITFDILCDPGTASLCGTPTTHGTATGSASSGSTTLTTSGVSGTITAGDIVVDAGGAVPWLTRVDAVAGSTVTLSQKTTGSISDTVSFYQPISTLAAATNGTVSAGSTALTIVVPATGTVAAGQIVGGNNIPAGTFVTAVSGTSVTLSQPVVAAGTNAGVWFWAVNSNFEGIKFGKWSSCSIASKIWYSGQHFDPYGAWGAFAPN